MYEGIYVREESYNEFVNNLLPAMKKNHKVLDKYQSKIRTVEDEVIFIGSRSNDDFYNIVNFGGLDVWFHDLTVEDTYNATEGILIRFFDREGNQVAGLRVRPSKYYDPYSVRNNKEIQRLIEKGLSFSQARRYCMNEYGKLSFSYMAHIEGVSKSAIQTSIDQAREIIGIKNFFRQEKEIENAKEEKKRTEIYKSMNSEEKARLDALDKEYRDICKSGDVWKTWTSPGGQILTAFEAMQYIENLKEEVYTDAEERIKSN